MRSRGRAASCLWYGVVLFMVWSRVFCTTSLCQGRLIFVPFGEEGAESLSAVTCSDGSPSGIYVEESAKANKTNPLRQLIVFIGGGACTSPQDCAEGYQKEPFKFSSTFNPQSFEGDTVLSKDPIINPALYDYTMTMVPYCTQDFFLGDNKRGKTGNFSHSGSAMMEAAIAAWSERLPAQAGVKHILESVVVVGLSAGSIGVMNHIDLIRNAVGNRAASLRFLLDSPSVVSDRPYAEKDFNQMALTYIDLGRYPYCDPLHPYSRLYRKASALPCCMSVHCMLRHHLSFIPFFLPEESEGVIEGSEQDARNSTLLTTKAKEDMLILDSAYDVFEMIVGSSMEVKNEGQETTFRERTSDFYSTMEAAGSRKTRSVETAASAKLAASSLAVLNMKNPQEPRVRWLFTSCVTHTFLVPAREFLFLSCNHGNYTEESFEIVCSDDGFAIQVDLEKIQLYMRNWRTVDTWRQVEFEGKSMRQIISSFVESISPAQEFFIPPVFSEELIDARRECEGPNCLADGRLDSDSPSCQALIEIESPFRHVPFGLQVFLVAIFFIFVTSLFARCTKVALPEKDIYAVRPTNPCKPSSKPDINLLGVRVCTSCKDNSKVLLDANLNLPGEGLVAVVGKSGSGKSTLLSVLSQRKHELNVRIQEGEAALTSLKKSYLRQGDLLAFENVRPCDLLLINAKLFGATKVRTQELYCLMETLLKRNDSTFNPFTEARIGNLSGGQRRLLAIANTLLRDTSMLLLDEPLSGLDSLSSLELVESLKTLARANGLCVVVVVHQASREILSYFDRLVAMDAGRIEYQGTVSSQDPQHARYIDQVVRNLRRVPSTVPTYSSFEEPLGETFSGSDIVSSAISKAKSNSSKSTRSTDKSEACVEAPNSQDHEIERDSGICMNEFIRQIDNRGIKSHEDMISFLCQAPPSRPFLKDVELPSNETLEGESTLEHEDLSRSSDETDSIAAQHKEKDRPLQLFKCKSSKKRTGLVGFSRNSHIFLSGLSQTGPLIKRMHMDTGFELTDIALICILYAFVAVLINLEKESESIRVFLSVTFMVSMPPIVFANKAVRYGQLWLEHRCELDDRLIKLPSFLVATYSFMITLPLIGIFLATLVIYAIVGLSMETYFVQVSFSALTLLSTFGVARVLTAFVRGDATLLVQFITVFLTLSVSLSSLLVASWKFPPEARWLVYFSVNFWAASGSVMTHFDPDVAYDNSESCNDILTCLASDGRVIVHTMGFGQLSNQRISALVLTTFWFVLVVLEYFALKYRRR